MREEVLAFKRDLFPQLPYRGFLFNTQILYNILSQVEIVDRETTERNPVYKQIVSYAIIRHGESIFRYKRSAWGNDERLKHFFSIGVGGHVSQADVLPLFSSFIPATEWGCEREVREEFFVDRLGQPRLIGLLNDDSNDVGRVHFGVIYEYALATSIINPKEKRAHIQSGFVPIIELLEKADDYENWSRIIINEYLNQKYGVTVNHH